MSPGAAPYATGGDPPQLHAVAEQLRGISEELADLALEQLHQAVGAGRTTHDRGMPSGPMAVERRITRARRAVERAAAILDPPGSADLDGDLPGE